MGNLFCQEYDIKNTDNVIIMQIELKTDEFAHYAHCIMKDKNPTERYFNENASHRKLGNRAPGDVFCQRKPLSKAA